MDCPYCGKEMQAGRIPSQGRLKWYDGVDDTIFGKGILLSEAFQDVTGYFCPECRRIVLPVPEIEGVWDKVQRTVGAASEKLDAMRGQLEERQAQADQTKRQKEKEKKGKKDPWES